MKFLCLPKAIYFLKFPHFVLSIGIGFLFELFQVNKFLVQSHNFFLRQVDCYVGLGENVLSCFCH